MGKNIAIHSYKGGTGKSFIAANIALIYASQGYKMCLLDFDFRAPSVQSLFEVKPGNRFVNDFLDGRCEVQDILIDISEKFNSKGKIFVGLADRSIEGMTQDAVKDRRWQMSALGRLTSAIKTLRSELGFNYVLIDTSPGFHYSSLNALLASELTLLVTTLDKSDFEGTVEMIEGIYETLERKTGIVLNKVPRTVLEDPERMRNILAENKTYYKFPIIETLPCDCDVVSMRGDLMLYLRQPNHPVTETLMKLTKKIDEL